MTARPDILTACALDKPVTLPYSTVVKALCDGRVSTEHGLMHFGTNYTFLVSIQHEDADFLVIYKPRAGERPLWDFPDGTLCQRETAAWVMSEALGWSLVPPTVLREGPRGTGSMQVFINHDPQQHYFTFDEAQEEQLQRMVVFDAICNNADRKGGHCLLDADDHIWGIDHGLTFNTSHKLRTVIWDFAGQPLPEDIINALQQLCSKLDDAADVNRKALAQLLTGQELRSLQTRVKRLLQLKTFPMLGPGPNRPWPAL
jgi:uncharacterized repeat protein (TIGR03843 family)